ncbi:MAG: peptidoglycan-associated lipoprotein Pal [Pseudomonadota bacterium]
MKNLLHLIAVCLIFTACSSTPKTVADKGKQGALVTQANPVLQIPSPPQPTPIQRAPSTPLIAQSTHAVQMNTALQRDTAANNRMPQNESIYFDFDQSELKPQYRDAIQHHAGWIKRHENDEVTLEGNTDERGSSEYNLALGSRRAATVHRMLVTLGVPQQNIKDVSFGEEKPKAGCSEESCWKENRRVDFVYKLNQ